jgi:hypothetical protein
VLRSDTPLTTQTRRTVTRSVNGWKSSTMWGYVYGDNSDSIFRENIRMNKANFLRLVNRLQSAKVYEWFSRRDLDHNIRGVVPSPLPFRVATVLYLFAHGGNLKVVADVASVSKQSLRIWVRDFCTAVNEALVPDYMPFKPPSAVDLQLINRRFASRRGMPNVANAVDGTHVRFDTADEEYQNYKGWKSILCVCFVNSYYLFVYADVGHAGRCSDNTVLKHSKYMAAANEDRTLWLGKGGIILADGGARDAGDILMNPYFNPKTAEQFWFNFCQSSSRFFVEETFGRWKNRWRFLLRPCDTKHELTSRMIYASMVLHNFLTRHKDAATFDEADDAKTWTDFYRENKAMLCPSCARRQPQPKHCVHVERNDKRASQRSWRKPSEQRDHLRDRMWRELVQPSSIRDDDDALLQTSDDFLDDDDVLAASADRAAQAELGGVVVDNPEYQLMLRRALNGYIR